MCWLEPTEGGKGSYGRWEGLGIERSIVGARGALGVEGAGRLSSGISIASSLSEEEYDNVIGVVIF